MAPETNFSDDDRDDDFEHDEDERDEGDEDEEEEEEGRGGRSSRRDRGDEVDEDEDEGEDEDGEEEEEQGDDEDDDGPDLGDLERIASGGGMVPYSRLAALADQNHKLTEALIESRAASVKKNEAEENRPPPVDIKALRKKHTEAILDGKEDEAAALAEQIDEANIAKAEERALARLREEQQHREQQAYAKSMRDASDVVLRKYPSLNNFESDPDAADDMDRIIVERDLLIRRGVPGPKAMRQAADKVMGGSERRGATERDIRRRSERESIRARAKTAARIPPKTGGSGVGQRGRQHREPGTFSARQVAQMSDYEKRKARGDFDV